MNVPFLDLAVVNLPLKVEIDAAIARVISSGLYVLGEEVEAFEEAYARYCGAKYCVGVGNGFDALHLALRAVGIGAGDEVVVPSNTYIATWLAVSHTGARPVPVEPDAATFNLDPAGIEAAITARTRAILPVHLYGHPADMDPILALARRYGLRVIDDAAQAHGALYKGRRIGGLAEATAWSFYPTKNLGALGDGGAITTNDRQLAETLRKLRNYGSDKKNVHTIRGFNSRLDPIQAAVLRVKLAHLDAGNAARQAIASTYIDSLQGSGLMLPRAMAWADSAWHLFVVRSGQRDQLQASLSAAGIGTQVHYPTPPHLQDAYADLGYRKEAFPLAECMHAEALSLPLFPGMNEAQVAAVIKACQASTFN